MHVDVCVCMSTIQLPKWTCEVWGPIVGFYFYNTNATTWVPGMKIRSSGLTFACCRLGKKPSLVTAYPDHSALGQLDTWRAGRAETPGIHYSVLCASQLQGAQRGYWQTLPGPFLTSEFLWWSDRVIWEALSPSSRLFIIRVNGTLWAKGRC